MRKFLFICEVRTKKVLPTVKRALIVRLYERGHSVSEISKMLGMTPAAVSQYIHGRRGKEIDVEGIEELVKLAEKGELTQEHVCSVCDKLASKLGVE